MDNTKLDKLILSICNKRQSKDFSTEEIDNIREYLMRYKRLLSIIQTERENLNSYDPDGIIYVNNAKSTIDKILSEGKE